MSDPHKLSPAAEKLLNALIAATRKGATAGTFVVRRSGYEFEVDLDGYSHVLASPEEKAEFEASLKSLMLHGLLRRSDIGVGTGQQWEYTLSGDALKEVQTNS